MWADSSAAKAAAGRLGLGRIRHIDARFLWLQEGVRQRRLEIRRIRRGDLNPVDAMTKPMSVTELRVMLGAVNIRVVAALWR